MQMKPATDPQPPQPARRSLIGTMAGAAAGMVFTPLAAAAAGLPSMTAGPFYPSPGWRARQLDWDADLTRVGDAPEGRRAGGEWLDLFGTVLDRRGRAIDGAEIEIWQCDIHGSYRHPRGAGAQIDEAFQGFGSSSSDGQGRFRFRTIRPVPYPGRTPHIHVRLRHPSFGEFTSQLFVAGEPANARDFLYRQMSSDEREASEMRLQRAPADAPVRWLAERPLVLPIG